MRKQITYPIFYLFVLLIFSCSSNEDKESLSNSEQGVTTDHQRVLSTTEKKFVSKTNINENQIITSFGFYSGKSLHAMSFYETVSDTVKHSFWMNEKGKIINLEKFNQNAGPLIINSYNNLLIEELDLKGIEVDRISTFHNSEASIDKKVKTRDLSTNSQTGIPDNTYLNYIAHGYDNLNWKQSSSSVNCLSGRAGCYYKPDWTCVVSGSGNPLDPNNPGYCWQHPYEDCMKSKYENSPELKNEWNDNLYYSFKDDFLAQSSFGRKYINYYYALSNHLSNKNLSYSLRIKTATTLPLIHSKLNLLLDNSQDGLVLSARDAKTLNSLLNDYKELSNNPDFHLIITNIQNDIRAIYNQSLTKSQFLNSI